MMHQRVSKRLHMRIQWRPNSNAIEFCVLRLLKFFAQVNSAGEINAQKMEIKKFVKISTK